MSTPFYPQQQYQCGPAALATLLNHSQIPVSVESLVPLVYLPGKKGSLQVELLAASRRFGRIPYPVNPELSALIEELQAGRPVLVLQNLGLRFWPLWHYAVVIGYAVEQDEIILRSGITRRETLSARRFMTTWKGGGNWAMVLIKPGELPARPEQLPYLKAVASMEGVAPAHELISAYRAALEQWPDNPVALFGLAASLHTKGELTMAGKYYRKLLAAYPGHVAAQNNLAGVLADQGYFEEALLMIQQALEQQTGELHQHLLDTKREIEERRQPGPDNINGH